MQTRIGFAQYHVQFGEYDRNVDAIRRLAAEASDADLLVFPELGLTGYDFLDRSEVERYAEPFDAGPTSDLLRRLAGSPRPTPCSGIPNIRRRACSIWAWTARPTAPLANSRTCPPFPRRPDSVSTATR